MSIEFLIRKTSVQSPYREAIKKLIEMEGNKLIIATGYINNGSNKNNAEALKYIGDLLKDRIKGGPFYLTILGGKKDTDYPNNAIEFCRNLNKYVRNKNLNINLRRIYGDCWHGKIAIKVDFDSKIYGMLLGSSNFTPASILIKKLYFSMEADIFIVNRKIVKNYKAIENNLDTMEIRKEYKNWSNVLEYELTNFKELDLSQNLVDEKIIELRKFILSKTEELKENTKWELQQKIKKQRSRAETIIWIKVTMDDFKKMIDCLDKINEYIERMSKENQILYSKVIEIKSEEIPRVEKLKRIKQILENDEGSYNENITVISELLKYFSRYRNNYNMKLNEATQDEILQSVYGEIDENIIKLSETIYTNSENEEDMSVERQLDFFE